MMDSLIYPGIATASPCLKGMSMYEFSAHFMLQKWTVFSMMLEEHHAILVLQLKQICGIDGIRTGFPINSFILDAQLIFYKVDQDEFFNQQRTRITHQPTSYINIIAPSTIHSFLCVYKSWINWIFSGSQLYQLILPIVPLELIQTNLFVILRLLNINEKINILKL